MPFMGTMNPRDAHIFPYRWDTLILTPNSLIQEGEDEKDYESEEEDDKEDELDENDTT